jgi:malonate semialdehyde decarboxylase
MPLQRFDLVAGRTASELKSLLDAAQRAVVAAFHVPASDRYQVVHQHARDELLVEDTGLGFPRSDRIVVLSLTSRPREESAKIDFYRRLCLELEVCGVRPDDVVVSIVSNGDADWSFGQGRAQYVTGELSRRT